MEQKKIIRDIVLGLVMAVFSLITIYKLIPDQIQLATTYGEEIGVNSRTFPYFTAAIIGIAAGIHLIVSIYRFIALQESKKTQNAAVEAGSEEGNMHGNILTVVMFLLFALYAVLFQKFGYIVSSIIVPPLVLAVLRSKKISHYISVYGFVAFIFVIFQYLLNIQLIR